MRNIKDKNLFSDYFRKHPGYFAFISYVFLTIIIARPILQNLNNVIIGNDNDVYINPWADWWTLKALTDSNETLWQTDYLFYPQGANLTYHSFSHLNTLVSLALRPLFGALSAFNLTILLNFILNALAMFHLSSYLTNSNRAAFLAGFIFAFNSHSLYQSSHPVLVSIWCFPWLTLYLIRSVREGKVKWAIIAALITFLGAATSTILVVLMAMWLPILFLYMVFSKQFPSSPMKAILIYTGVSTILIFPMVFPLLRELILFRNDTFVMATSDSIQTDLSLFFIPHWYFWQKRGLYLGVVPTFLLLLAWKSRRNQARLWWILILVSFMFAIGAKPTLFGTELPITLPWVYLVAPVLRNMYRVNILIAFALAVLAAIGWKVLCDQLQERYRLPIYGLFLFFLLADYFGASFPYRELQISPFYAEILPFAGENEIVANLPMGRQEGKRYLYYQTIHEHKITGGVISRASEDTFSYLERNPVLRAGMVDLDPVPFPLNSELYLNELARDNVLYLVLDKELSQNTSMNLEEWRENIPREPFYEDDLVLVYKTR